MEIFVYFLLGLALVAALIYAGVVSVSVFKEITFLRWRRRMLAVPIPEPVHESEPVPVTPPKEKGTWVRFAGKWMECRMEGGQGGRGMPTLAVVRLTDKRTHSRRIVRLLDDVREMNA